MQWCSTHYVQDNCDEIKPKDPMTAAWDDIDSLLTLAPRSKQGMLYKTLYNLGWRLDGIDREISKAWKEEHPK
jgi:hypothetical protein